VPTFHRESANGEPPDGQSTKSGRTDGARAKGDCTHTESVRAAYRPTLVRHAARADG
jgi:hypothetical protein